MAMTKRERVRLESILRDIERGLAYIDQPETFIARKARMAGAMAFTRTVTEGQVEHCMSPSDPLAYPGEQSIAIVAKDIGSEFVCIRTARRHLAEFLKGPNHEPV
jgi:hypothetical protein